jgi:sugar transferase (PEP-CTERM/EpsH1 system associated)
MRLLFLTHRMPFPPNKGDKIRSFNILKHLTKSHDVYLACLVDDESDLKFVPEVERCVCRFVYERIKPRMKKLIALRGLFQSRPITVGYFYSSALQRQIDSIVDEVDMDAFVCFSSPMAEYLYRSRHADGKIRRALRVMDLIDVDSAKWRQYAAQGPFWTSLVYRHEARYLADYEQRIAENFDRVLVVSEQEKRVFPGGGDTPNLEAMSNGVDLEYFRPYQTVTHPATRPTLVFTGAMDYLANIDGIKWFVQSVLPRVKAAVPDVELLIVGGKPAREIERLGRLPGVVVTGYVEDVREYLARATVCIVPLRVARGIQNKVLEAMAMGKAVVCTPQAYEGIRAAPDKDLVVASGDAAFAAAIVDLLGDAARARQLGIAARQCVEKWYAWEENLGTLDHVLAARQVALQPPAPGARGAQGSGTVPG